MSTQCRFCGEAVRPDSMFCPSCGQLIGASASTPVPAFGTGTPSSGSKAAEEAAPAAPIAPVPLPTPLQSGARTSSAPQAQEQTPQPAASDPASASDPAPVADDAAPANPAASVEDADAQSSSVEPYVPAAAVRLPDGSVLPVDRMLVIGRSPERGAPEHGGVPVRLADPERAMSRVHLLIAPDPAGAVATDQGSANGTLLERDGVRYALVAGTPTVLVRGDRLVLGDAVLIAE